VRTSPWQLFAVMPECCCRASRLTICESGGQTARFPLRHAGTREHLHPPQVRCDCPACTTGRAVCRLRCSWRRRATSCLSAFVGHLCWISAKGTREHLHPPQVRCDCPACTTGRAVCCLCRSRHGFPKILFTLLAAPSPARIGRPQRCRRARRGASGTLREADDWRMRWIDRCPLLFPAKLTYRQN
jgi:hypothetical protein